MMHLLGTEHLYSKMILPVGTCAVQVCKGGFQTNMCVCAESSSVVVKVKVILHYPT